MQRPVPLERSIQMTGNGHNQYTDHHFKTCEYEGCNIKWDFKVSGMGAKKYCEVHGIIIRKMKLKEYERIRYLRKKDEKAKL